MPLDPSIISSYNPTSGIDLNALMTQRMQGMANINEMERQRRADALALEDRAAAQKKEEAAALVTTLAPAYATAFKGKGTKEAIMAGYNILPPEVQATVKPQIDSLMSMPSDDLRLAALESSLAGSDLGRTLLDRIPTEIQRINADIQQGQLTLAQQKFKAEQAAGPPADYQVVTLNDGTQVLIDRKTGATKVPTMPTSAGAEAGTPIKVEPKKTGGEITQAERRAASLLDNVVRNAGAVNAVITQTPEAFKPTAVEAASGFLPWGERQAAAWQQTPERKIVYNRMLQSIDALLTLATGAAYTKPQLETQLGAYLPGFFDEDAVKRDKVLALRDRIESEKINAGRAWTAEQEAKAEEVFRQFETLAETMSGGEPAQRGTAGDEGDVDTNNPLLQAPK